MSDERQSSPLHQRQSCCRLCLAPDNECISILNSYAADKELLSTKIHSCVSIKITTNDRLSLRICHACISYLNSWQSFKNRCLAAQKKQRSWLEGDGGSFNSKTDNPTHDDQQQQQQQHQSQDDTGSVTGLSSSILEGISSLKKRKSLTVYVSPSPKPNQTQPSANAAATLTTKRPYKYKPRQTNRQPGSIQQTQTQTQIQMQTQSQMQTQTQAQTLTHTQMPHLANLQYIDQVKHNKNNAQQMLLPVQPAPLLTEMFVPPVVSAAPTATITSAALACAAKASSSIATATGTASASVCQNAVQQLRLFRRYSYNPLPAIQIKDEPMDADDDYNSTKQHDESDEIVDPTMFLERTADEGDEPLMESTGFDYDSDQRPTPHTVELRTVSSANVLKNDSKEASCRACNLKFSTRANARRHERNLHPNLFESLSNAAAGNAALTKHTAALNASLELQRAVAAAVAADACKLNTSGLMSTQKYRQEVVNAFNNSEMGGWDYDSPEKYQQLLTDEKIVFLQQNEEFLQQYQTMTCRCCNKYYSTYKKFMAHMRKKYLTLPRNLCFNCLKLNDSKALFISHLKRRNCINLYKVLKNLMAKSANFAAAVTATVAATPEKMRAKELLVNKMYECKLCPKTYRLKLEFRSHVYEEHGDAQRKNLTPTQCKFCAVDIEEPAERKRHYNNMECIVVLRCITCDTKHDNYQKFMEHVQEKHLPAYGDQPQFLANTDNVPGKKANLAEESQSRLTNLKNLPGGNVSSTAPSKSQCFSRMPQACPICGQQYNNYNNVLRHMESKHPDQLPQTYKCVKCGVGYPRLSNLRDHMVNAHESDKIRHTGFDYIVNAETVKPSSTNQNTYSGRYDYVMKDLMSITNGGTADDDRNSGNIAKRIRLDNNASNTNTPNGQKECPICKAVFNNNIGLSNHMRSHQLQNPMAVLAAKAASANANSSHSHPVQHAILKRTLEQAADRRFRRMRCRICQRRFSTKKSYRYHMFNDHQIRNVQFIKCQLCDAEFAYEKGLKVHMFKVHNTLLKDEMIIKQYECEICSMVYRTDVELQHHLANVHEKQSADENLDADDLEARQATDRGLTGGDVSGLSTPVSGASGGTSGVGSVAPLYWYQCKYCPSNFNTNKKLAIHINSHDEFDSNDYSCKDCGNVYSGRKSLWVHRYKKHPQIAEPSECHMCKKVFFDGQMLEHHIPSCNRTPLKTTAGGGGLDSGQQVYKHKTGDDEDDDDETSRDADDDTQHNTSRGPSAGSASNLKIKFPEVACTICGARFTDQELFTKHFQMHEMELYTDNPLASMFDTEPADPNQFYMDRMNENGEYSCDLCTKTFTQMTAFKVHRKWHFRGDSKQSEADQHTLSQASTASQQQPTNEQYTNSISSHPHLLGLQAVGLMPRQSMPILKSQKRKRELKCQYCPSTFISNNNLRRHLYELHKNEIGNLPVPPKIQLDAANTCRRCNLKFETKSEWIEHKVTDARVMKPFGPFQWGCDLCGAYVSRKEKLINHIHNHMKEQNITPVEQPESSRKSTTQTLRPQSSDSHKSLTKELQPMTIDKIKKEPQTSAEDEQPLQESGDSSKDQYDDIIDEVGEDDEPDDEEEDAEGMTMAAAAAASVEYDEEEEDSPVEEELDEMVVGAQQTVGADDDDLEDDDEEREVDEEEDEEEEDEEEAADSNDEINDTPNHPSHVVTKQVNLRGFKVVPHTVHDTIDSDEYEDDDEDEYDSSTENRKPVEVINKAIKSRFSCDLCQVFFDSQPELQKHVKMHFLNGPGSVTLTEINKSKSASSNKSRSSSSDVVT